MDFRYLIDIGLGQVPDIKFIQRTATGGYYKKEAG